MKVFCIHFAGGNKFSYRGMEKVAPEGVKLISLELPGRGTRPKEPLLKRAETAVDDLFVQVKEQLDEPYMIYGHSMGALLGFLLIHKIREAELKQPEKLIVSGRKGPVCSTNNDTVHLLPKTLFVSRLRDYGGIPDALLNEPELLDYFIPIIRADFQLIETYQHKEMPKLAMPITAVIGAEETITDQEAEAWKEETAGAFEYLKLKGGHFFILNNEEEMVQLFTERELV